jgi:site-specific DNA-methyltransferase (adenine-specific)
MDFKEGLAGIPTGSIDQVVTDPPYGTTDCPWDKKVDPHVLMQELLRVTKPNGAIIIFADQKLAVDLISAARRFFRYDLVWAKTAPVGFLNANRMPLRAHELILVFYQRLPRYTPQFVPGELRRRETKKARGAGVYRKTTKDYVRPASSLRYPTSVLTFRRDPQGIHPTQKPVALVEWLVRSFSNSGDTIIDPFIGSGTTAEACLNTDRNCIGFEKDEGIFEMARGRVTAVSSCGSS